MVPTCQEMGSHSEEYDWLVNAEELFDKEDLESYDFISWAAYHVSISQPNYHPPGICEFLPLLAEKVDSPATVKHGMIVIQKAIEFLNPGQIPIMAVDQPLYAIGKRVQ